MRICVGSHRDGLRPVTRFDPRNREKKGAYGLTLVNEAEVVQRYECVSPLSKPGDLIVMDFLTLHESGINRGNRSRWSMQFRYFNFNDPTGQSFGWKGSFASGFDFASIHPEMVAGDAP
jgi:ectoine hydroxylase-related dioxygenase (phytanoyl-CoA dioxygenase family)